MKIINLEEFLKLPSNTLFHKYTPQVFGGLQVKACDPFDNYAPSFYVKDLYGFTEGSVCSETNSDIIDSGSFKWDLNSVGRDGMYDYDQLFCVYENDDVERLILQLSMCLNRTAS